MTDVGSASVGEALREGRATLREGVVEDAAVDARLLLAAACGLDMASLIARRDEQIGELALACFRHHIGLRALGMPVARILGEAEFFGRVFKINGATLVPRPETETLVEAVLPKARALPRPLICDLGTGSGIIAITLLVELPEARAVAVDISAEALEAAHENAARHGVAGRLLLVLGDFASSPWGRFDIVVSNPPYVKRGDIAGLSREVREHDPHAALDGGEDGLEAYRAILARSGNLLAADGFLAFETGFDQGDAVSSLCRAAGLSGIAIGKDIGGRDRVVTARRSASLGSGGAAKKALGEVG